MPCGRLLRENKEKKRLHGTEGKGGIADFEHPLLVKGKKFRGGFGDLKHWGEKKKSRV